MRKKIGTLLLFASALLIATVVLAQTPNGTPLPTLSLKLVESGFVQPVDITNAGDDRLFIVERAGRIFVIDDGEKVNTPFLDIDGRVDSQSHSERGLLGLVFHPDYPNTPYFYVNYINNSGNTTIARFTADDTNNIADPTSEFIILTIDQPAPNHNAGDLNFGIDGYLYIATGDGGSAGDPFGEVGNGQETQTLLGKILRIDVDGGSPYTIPSDNPFVNDPNTLDEIWALGLRNPWRFSFDRQTQDLFIADVGQNSWEEVNFTPASSNGGENYGWRCYEGTHPFNTTDCQSSDSYIFPFDDYPHSNPSDESDEGSSVTGGFVYRGETHPDLQGIYLYGDFVSANVWLAVSGGAGNWTAVPYGNIDGLNNISTFGEGCSGELFVADYGGQIYQIETAVVAPPPPPGTVSIYLPLINSNNIVPSRACTS